MGNPFVHVELNTTDVSKAKKFYGLVCLAVGRCGDGAQR